MRRLGVVGLALAATLLMVSPASADEVTWKYGWLGANGGRDASASYPQFRASGAVADSLNHKIRAGAHYPGGWTLYASFAEGWGSACHSYAGDQDLGALLENPHTVDQYPVIGVLRFYQWETPC